MLSFFFGKLFGISFCFIFKAENEMIATASVLKYSESSSINSTSVTAKGNPASRKADQTRKTTAIPIRDYKIS